MGAGDLLTADQSQPRSSAASTARCRSPCKRLTMFIDVQENMLFYVVAAWEDDFSGYVLDYGAYPDQQRPYFTLRDARRTLAIAAPRTGLEGSIYAGLER